MKAPHTEECKTLKGWKESARENIRAVKTMTTTTTELIKEFNDIQLMRIFEIEVLNKATQAMDWRVFNISINENKLIAQHVGLTKEEEESKKIAFKGIPLDDCFSLDENLQELHAECIEAIVYSDFYQLTNN